MRTSKQFAALTLTWFAMIQMGGASSAWAPQNPAPTFYSECSECPPTLALMVAGHPPGWPELENCTSWPPLRCYIRDDFPSIGGLGGLLSEWSQETIDSGGASGPGCLYICWTDGMRSTFVTQPVLPHGCPHLQGCAGPFPVPWIDNDGDGIHAWDDDDESSTPFPPDSTDGERWNDDDGDGIPNVIDMTPDDPDGPSGWAPMDLTEPGSEDAFKNWLEVEFGVEWPPDLPPPPSFEDVNTDGLLHISELAPQLGNYVKELTAAINSDTDQSLEDRLGKLGSLQTVCASMTQVLQAVYGDTPSVFSRLKVLAYSLGNQVRALENNVSASDGTTIEIAGQTGTSIDIATVNEGEYAHHQDDFPGTSTTLIDSTGASIPFPHQASPQPYNGQGLQTSTADPVDTSRGEFYHRRTDLFAKGRGMDLSLERVYLSRSRRLGIVGHNWSMAPLETHMLVWPQYNGERVLDVFWGNGGRSFYRQVETGDPNALMWEGINGAFGKVRWYSGETFPQTDCSIPDPQDRHSGGFVVREPNGTLYYFCPPVIRPGTGRVLISHLRKVSDPYGNAITFRRNANGHATTVIDTLGRHIELEYDEETGLLSRIEDWAGRVVTYEYDPETRDLLKVIYPETEFLSPQGVVEAGSRYEGYQYHQHPDSFELNPEPNLNHNLKEVWHSDAGPSVKLDYYVDEGYSYDRVSAVEVSGQVTTFTYESFDESHEDPYGQNVTHLTTAKYPDGEIEHFFHSDGLLLRHEIRNGRFTLGGALIADSADPEGPGEWVTVLEYSDEGILIEKLVTTDLLYPAGRRTQRVLDSENADRFQQANVLEIVDHPYGGPSSPAELRTIFEYEPVTASVVRRTDPLGRVTVETRGHQELSYDQVRALPAIAGWGILDPTPSDPSLWGTGDVNEDGVLGGTFEVVELLLPISPKVDPSGPAGPVDSDFRAQFLYQYNTVGQVVGRRDEAGSWTRLTYQGGFVRQRVQDEGGLGLTYTYGRDSLGRLLHLRKPDGNTSHFAYDPEGLLAWATDRDFCNHGGTGVPCPPNHGIWVHAYHDQAGNLVGVAPPLYGGEPVVAGIGTVPQLERLSRFDVAGNEVERRRQKWDGTLVGEGVWDFEYDGRGRPFRQISPSGLVIRYERDSRGLVRLVEAVGPAGTIEVEYRFVYDDFGDLVQAISPEDSDNDGQNDTTLFTTDGYGRLIQTIDPEGLRAKYDLDAAGRVLQVSVYYGATLVHRESSEYDGRDRAVHSVLEHYRLRANGTVVPADPPIIDLRHGYGARAGELLWTNVAGGGTERLLRHEYDTAGRQVGRWMGSGYDLGSSFVLDSMGRITYRFDVHDGEGRTGPISPSTSAWEYDYDEHGRAVGILSPDGGGYEFEYTPRGQLARRTTPEGRTTEWEYDWLGLPKTVHESGPGGGSRAIAYTFGIEDQLLSITRPGGGKTDFEYDALLRLVRRIQSPGIITQYAYDAASRLDQLTRPGGITVGYDYDGSDRLLALSAMGADANVVRSYAYDALGNLTQVNEQIAGRPQTVVSRESTSLGFLEQEGLATPGGSRSFSVLNNLDGNPLRIDYPSGQTVFRGYDGHGRTNSVTSSTGGTLAIYDESYGNTYLRAVLSGGARIEQDFDPVGRVIGRSFRSGTQVLHGWALTYTPDGNLWTRRRLQDARSEVFGYDDFDRLVYWDRQGAGALPPRTASWQWDARDNLQSSSDSVHGGISTSVNLLDQLLAASPEISSIAYRLAGEEHDRDFASGGERTILWDALGRPLESTSDQAGPTPLTVEWLHDGLDRLVGRVASSGDATWSWYVGPHLLATSSNTWGESELVHGHNFDEVLWRERNGVEQYYAFTGPFGDLEAWLTPASVVEAYDYDPFGLPRDPVTGSVVASSAIGNTLFFLSKPFDTELGFSHLGRRLYDPVHGRFLSRDPLGELVSPNLYSYPGQNPFRWKDPSGLQGEAQTVLPRIIPDQTEAEAEDEEGETGVWTRSGNSWAETWDEAAREYGNAEKFNDLSAFEKARVLLEVIERTLELLRLYNSLVNGDPLPELTPEEKGELRAELGSQADRAAMIETMAEATKRIWFEIGTDISQKVSDVLSLKSAGKTAVTLGARAPEKLRRGWRALKEFFGKGGAKAGGEAARGARHTIPEGRVGHIFRNAPGHLPDTAANRRLLQGVADDASTTLGVDKWGNTWSARTLGNGTQVWVQTRGGQIVNGGLNQVPRAFNPGTGLSVLGGQ